MARFFGGRRLAAAAAAAAVAVEKWRENSRGLR